MFPGMEMMACTDLAVPREVMQHVVRVESAFNPYAIGVVGGRLARQPRNLAEAVSTTRMLEKQGYNFSLGLAQVNRYNLAPQGLGSYEAAFAVCPNLQAGSRILAECYGRSGNDWGKAFSCYYSGNFTTGFRHGYVQKVFASWRQASGELAAAPIAVIDRRRAAPAATIAAPAGPAVGPVRMTPPSTPSLVARRIEEAALSALPPVQPPAAVMPPLVDPVPAELSGPRVAQPAGARTAGMPDLATVDAPVLVQLVGVVPDNARITDAAARPSGSVPSNSGNEAPAPASDSAFVF